MLTTIENQLKLTTNTKKDIFTVIVTIVLLTVFAIQIDLFEVMVKFGAKYERWELDEFILTIFASVFPILWFSFRRYEEIANIKKDIESINKDLKRQLQDEVEKSNKLLKKQNVDLQEQIDKAVEQIRKQDDILNQQSKMVAMGEMIESIAHQWKQPLSVISTSISGVSLNKELGILNDEILKDNNDLVLKNVHYLAKTIDDFKNFFSSEKNKKEFDIKDIYATSYTLIWSTFKTITFVENIKSVKLNGYSNELIQVFINILNNARDEIKRAKVRGLLFIDIYEDEEYAYIRSKTTQEGFLKISKIRFLIRIFPLKRRP